MTRHAQTHSLATTETGTQADDPWASYSETDAKKLPEKPFQDGWAMRNELDKGEKLMHPLEVQLWRGHLNRADHDRWFVRWQTLGSGILVQTTDPSTGQLQLEFKQRDASSKWKCELRHPIVCEQGQMRVATLNDRSHVKGGVPDRAWRVDIDGSKT